MVLQNGEKHNGESYKTANLTKNGEYHLEYIDISYLNKTREYGSIIPAAQAILQRRSPIWQRRSRWQKSNEEPPKRKKVGPYRAFVKLRLHDVFFSFEGLKDLFSDFRNNIRLKNSLDPPE